MSCRWSLFTQFPCEVHTGGAELPAEKELMLVTCSVRCCLIMCSTVFCLWILLEPGLKNNTFVKISLDWCNRSRKRRCLEVTWAVFLVFCLLVQILLIMVKLVLISESLWLLHLVIFMAAGSENAFVFSRLHGQNFPSLRCMWFWGLVVASFSTRSRYCLGGTATAAAVNTTNYLSFSFQEQMRRDVSHPALK